MTCYPSSEHLLRALIPHAVINHDVTAHLGRKGWIEPVLDPPADCDEAWFSVAPWAQGRDGFTTARLAALESLLPTAESLKALSAMAALRTALAEGIDDANAVSVAGDDTPGTPEVVEGAVAWLRASPVRCALDLPCLSICRVRFQHAPCVETLVALAPCVTHVHFIGEIEAEEGLNALPQLPHATQLSVSNTFVVKLMETLDRRIAENDDDALAVAKRLRRFSPLVSLHVFQIPAAKSRCSPT